VSVLGAAEVGKTSLMSRLCGGTFNRKTTYKTSTQEEPIKTSIEVVSSVGLLLFHFYDWAWVQQRKEVESNVFNRHLSLGTDGAIFMYSVISKESKRDFEFFIDWYERASGYDKPWCIISNKNDQKKRQVNEEEGKSLASKGNRRSYVAISLVDDSGVDDIMVTLGRLFMNDLNLTVRSFKVASEESMLWSANKREALLVSAHNDAAASNVTRTHRVLCLVPNAGIFEKMEQAVASTCHYLQSVSSIEAVEEQLLAMTLKAAVSIDDGSASSDTVIAPEANSCLPIAFVVGTPTLSAPQQAALKTLSSKYNVPCVITVPRSIAQELAGSK